MKTGDVLEVNVEGKSFTVKMDIKKFLSVIKDSLPGTKMERQFHRL